MRLTKMRNNDSVELMRILQITCRENYLKGLSDAREIVLNERKVMKCCACDEIELKGYTQLSHCLFCVSNKRILEAIDQKIKDIKT